MENPRTNTVLISAYVCPIGSGDFVVGLPRARPAPMGIRGRRLRPQLYQATLSGNTGYVVVSNVRQKKNVSMRKAIPLCRTVARSGVKISNSLPALPPSRSFAVNVFQRLPGPRT
ncbi:unnamed protein product [Ectocarpus sp. 4 AP-2014]